MAMPRGARLRLKHNHQINRKLELWAMESTECRRAPALLVTNAGSICFIIRLNAFPVGQLAPVQGFPLAPGAFFQSSSSGGLPLPTVVRFATHRRSGSSRPRARSRSQPRLGGGTGDRRS